MQKFSGRVLDLLRTVTSRSREGLSWPGSGRWFGFGFSLSLILGLALSPDGLAQFRSTYSHLPSVPGRGGRQAPQQAVRTPSGVYPEYASSYGPIRWLKEQMPLKVWVANGQAIDAILDPQLGAPYANVDNTNGWPDLVAHILETNKVGTLPQAEGFTPQQRQAAIDGISMWKPFEKEGLISYVFTDDPLEADIHLFWVNHFVNKQGMALFSNDIRGYTAKRSFPYKAIMAGKQAAFKPVVIILRTTDKHGQPMTYSKMRAAAAHEFGHALGIEGHSRNPGDLMNVYYGNGTISGSDAATLRYLYHQTPALIP